jgi:hypothetical protein
MPSKSRLPYRDRIVEYCARLGIQVPANFDAPKSSDRFVFVDVSGSQPVLLERSVAFTRDVTSILADVSQPRRKLVALDFKRQCEIHLSDAGRLECGDPIDALSAEERRRQEWLKR